MGCIITKQNRKKINDNKEYKLIFERDEIYSISKKKSIFGAFVFEKHKKQPQYINSIYLNK